MVCPIGKRQLNDVAFISLVILKIPNFLPVEQRRLLGCRTQWVPAFLTQLGLDLAI